MFFEQKTLIWALKLHYETKHKRVQECLFLRGQIFITAPIIFEHKSTIELDSKIKKKTAVNV